MEPTFPALPDPIARWFAGRGWTVRAHQLALLEKARAGRSALLVAPTGAGKTLAGFLPTLVDLAEGLSPQNRTVIASEAKRSSSFSPAGKEDGLPRRPDGLLAMTSGRKTDFRLHTLYISPLKALATDVARNLEIPVAEMGLPIAIETRTGDTPPHKRKRQVERPPDILLTTPEQLALLLANREARALFGGLKRVVLDELHALATSKRGDLLSLGVARLRTLAGPGLTLAGLSATVREPQVLARHLGPDAEIVVAPPGAPADLSILETGRVAPLAGHTALHAIGAIYAAIQAHRTSLVFVNTRMQAEFLFQELWRVNEDGLAIALHHGSLDVSQRRRVEAAMTEGRLRAVVCTSTLDLGIDWGDVDLVINVGAPKGASRLMQRIGRANHRLDEPSKALLVPSNRFEMLECRAALDAVDEAAQDSPDARRGALDVLAQHILGMACAEPFDADALFTEVREAAPYGWLDRETFGKALDFVATGGYALRAYERFARIRQGKDGLWRVSNARMAQQYRMNVGTIVEATMLKVRLGRPLRSTRPGQPGALRTAGRLLGEVEEYFAETMLPGDTFLFAGEVLRFEGISGDSVVVTRAAAGTDPKIPSYAGGKFPLSTFLAERVRGILADRAEWTRLPPELRVWLEAQAAKSTLPRPGELLVETFARGGRHYLVAYPFEGRLAHQTLGMLLTRRLERARLKPLGFVCNDYGLSVWGIGDIGLAIAQGRLSLDELFAQDMLGDDLEDWLAESMLMKRTFRYCAVIAGLIERRFPGQEKSGRQVTMSTDLVYDVLRRHEPDHILLQAARADAAEGLLDIRRLGQMLARIEGRIVHKPLSRVSPLGVSVILEIGREAVFGEAADAILAEAEATLLEEAMA